MQIIAPVTQTPPAIAFQRIGVGILQGFWPSLMPRNSEIKDTPVPTNIKARTGLHLGVSNQGTSEVMKQIRFKDPFTLMWIHLWCSSGSQAKLYHMKGNAVPKIRSEIPPQSMRARIEAARGDLTLNQWKVAEAPKHNTAARSDTINGSTVTQLRIQFASGNSGATSLNLSIISSFSKSVSSKRLTSLYFTS